jgi:PAS domain S-box-containing protein
MSTGMTNEHVDASLVAAARRAEQAMAASEMRYRRLFETAQDGILILEADSGEIIDVNPFLADLLGYARADFLGKHIWDFGPFHDVVASKDAFDQLQANDYIAYEDLPLQASDGHHIDVGFVSNVYEMGGERVIQCNIRDITARKAQDRARASLEDQLRASQKMEAIGGLAGGIAHDFNNLLSVILCYTKFALDTLPEGSELKADLIEVDKASRRATALTKQLLAFSRKQVMDPVPLDLNQVIESVETMFRRILGEDVALVHHLARDLGLTLVDRSQIEQVIMNLVVNARDAMPAGGTLTIETENVELDAHHAALHRDMTPGSHVLVTVTDSGCGMSAETQGRIFEPFYTTKASTGTGLGLSTVYGIVKQSGGNVCVASQPGHGTTFEIYLPRSHSARVAELARPPQRAPRCLTGTETILVVEDDDAVRSLAARILTAAGYTVLTACDGVEALRLCHTHVGELPLIVTDVVMPLLGGRLFAAEVHESRPATRMLFMSGYSDDAIAHHGVLAAGARFLGKPFSAAELTRKVREILDEMRDGARQPARSTPGQPPCGTASG